MPDRVAVLADIHCVLPALEAVLAEPDVRNADRIVLPGDVAVGPMPVQTFDLLTSLGDRVVWVSGNCERITLELARGTRTADDPNLAFAAWGATRLRPEHVALLDALPKTATLEVSGLGEVLFCHATPRDDEEFVLVDSPVERWQEVLTGAPRTVVCGHTHMPFIRQVDRRTIINPGSVGMPYGTTGAHWALLDGGIQLRRTEFDVDAAIETIRRNCDFPDIHDWLNNYLRNPPSDLEALEAFRT